ncbi:hypothetical protein CD58_18295 [Pseudomonas brassicacearum]|uniref:hypothetical protein n=1 Tax=Pseudomonas brassicacearum TaxID=930166 RepID=UPI00042F6983|nr:hypothetical protein [Pseudomonas brassicacearum]AHL34727.1 hypothetical protein CD58_18295 [Pseudomonas brassicacearum]
MKSLKRSRVPLPTLACWPQQWPESDEVWHIFNLQLKRDGKLDWFLRNPADGPITYNNLDDALTDVKATNTKLIKALDALALPPEEKLSIKLKVEKSITAEGRLMDEESWMLKEAINRHVNDPRPKAGELLLSPGLEKLREPLFKVLQQFPYIRYARISQFGITLTRKDDNDWTTRALHDRKTAIYCAREKIARGFNLAGTDHWGKTKAKIRSALLPRANQLLQETGFKMMLDDAKRRGQRVVVCGGFVFWYEEKDSVGWIVMQMGESSTGKEGHTLWREGTILSKNHGRIVVLPYIKESGEFVKGHTKNAPHDGKAKLRHPDHYVELPFEILDGDLMYDLLGRMKYE